MTLIEASPGELQIEDRLWRLSSDLMCVARTTGVLVAVNSAWTSVLGWREEEFVGVNVRHFVHPDDLAATQAQLDALADGAPILHFENRLRRTDGDYRHVSWRAAPESGLVFAVGRDITDRLAREDALRQSQKMEAVGQLAGGIAHDFNNLLTILRSSVELVQKPDTPEERRRRYISAIGATVDRAAKLTEQLLAFARRQKLEPEVFDVGEKIADVSQLLRPFIGDGIRLSTAVCSSACFVEADICQFETALINLAINARDAMKGQGEIEISARLAPALPPIRGHAGGKGAFVAISVQDNGPGVATHMQDKVFEPFFTTKEVGQGTGLGLSQVYGFVKQSGGNIDMQSPPGAGATFTIYLPQRPRPPAEDQAPRARRARPAADRLRVLVVEDNEDVGRFCSHMLNDLGHSPTWARNAGEAEALLKREARSFDVVFTDVVMPGMSGLELAERLRQTSPDIPVVLTSGYSQSIADGGTRGFKLVSKPYSPGELADALQEAVGRH